MVDVAHDGDHRRTGLEILLRVLKIVLVLRSSSAVSASFISSVHAEIAAHEAGGVKVQLVVDGGDDAQQHQLLDDLARGLADALGQVLDGDGLGGHVRLFNLDGGHELLRAGLLHARTAVAAHHIIIQPVEILARELLAVTGHTFRIVLAHVVFLVGIVVADAFLLNGRRHFYRGLASAHRGARTAGAVAKPAAHGTGSALTACGTAIRALRVRRAAIGALRICGTAIGTLRICGTAIRTLRICGAAIRTLRIRGTAIRTLRIRRAAIGTLRICGTAIRTLRVRRAAVGTLRICGTAIRALRVRGRTRGGLTSLSGTRRLRRTGRLTALNGTRGLGALSGARRLSALRGPRRLCGGPGSRRRGGVRGRMSCGGSRRSLGRGLSCRACCGRGRRGLRRL